MRLIIKISISIILIFSISCFAQDDDFKQDSGENTEEFNFEDFESVSEDAGLIISGALRNDGIYIKRSDDNVFNDFLDARIILQKKTSSYEMHLDGRVYALYGNDAKDNEEYEAKIMRAYARAYLFKGKVDITIGKTFINFGNDSIFNPLAINKDINFTDMNYDKEGLISSEIKYYPTNLSEGIIFASYSDSTDNYMTGFSNSFNIASFDLGFAAARYGQNKKQLAENEIEVMPDNHNKAGLFFKGDLFLGFEGAWAYHSDDKNEDTFHEAYGGFDYSLFTGHVIFQVLGYYNEKGAVDREEYAPVIDSFFKGRYYGFTALTVKPDEFFTISFSAFYNFADDSYLVLPFISYLYSDGFTISLHFVYPGGDGIDEFSSDLYGNSTVTFRTEIKF